MKAVVLHEYGPPSKLVYEEFADPTPARGEVLLRVHAVSVNPIDWKMRSGAAKDRFPLTLPGGSWTRRCGGCRRHWRRRGWGEDGGPSVRPGKRDLC